MIADRRYYIIMLISVLLASGIRDFILPSIVWRKYLSGKSYTFKFWFCVVTQSCLQINLVLFLGFFNICNPVNLILSNCLVYALILWNYSDKMLFRRVFHVIKEVWQAFASKKGFKYIGITIKEAWNKKRSEKSRKSLFPFFRSHWLEVILVFIVLGYNIWFLSYNVLRYHSYQFSDIPVHLSWIYGLEQGTLFSAGIYPFGMHSMLYFIRAVFNIELIEILLYGGIYQTLLLVMALYLLARELFCSKYLAVASIAVFSLMLNQGRYGASLPQEAGMYAAVGCGYFMLRYLKKEKKPTVIEGDSKIRGFLRLNSYINRRYLCMDGILLMLCVGLVIAYHFFTAIAAIFLIISIGLCFLPRILKKSYFVPLLFAGCMGVLIAVLPLAACFAKGIPFQESMDWAVTVIQGKSWKGSDAKYEEKLRMAQQGIEEEEEIVYEEEKVVKYVPDYGNMSFTEIVNLIYQSIYNFANMAMYGASASKLMYLCMGSGFILSLVQTLWKKGRHRGRAHSSIILYIFLLSLMGGGKNLGISQLIPEARAAQFSAPFIGIIFFLPIDSLFLVLSTWKNKYYQIGLNVLSFLCVPAAVFVVFYMGWYHNFFDVNLAYYNQPEYIVRHIRNEYEKDTFTVVSTTEEYYSVVDYGFHTQLSEFMNMVNKNQKEFTFPTEYVFFLIEKKVLQDYTYGSVEVSKELAKEEFIYLENSQDYYFQRAILESQAYYLAKKLETLYPNNFHVYYEDDIYIAYCLKQNTYSPYSMQIEYLEEE